MRFKFQFLAAHTKAGSPLHPVPIGILPNPVCRCIVGKEAVHIKRFESVPFTEGSFMDRKFIDMLYRKKE